VRSGGKTREDSAQNSKTATGKKKLRKKGGKKPRGKKKQGGGGGSKKKSKDIPWIKIPLEKSLDQGELMGEGTA